MPKIQSSDELAEYLPHELGLSVLDCGRCGEKNIETHPCPRCGFDPAADVGVCDVCGGEFETESGMKTHKRMAHENR